MGPTAVQYLPQAAPMPWVPALWEGFNAFSVANEPVSGGKLSEDVGSGPCTGFTGPAERRKEVTRLKRTHGKGPGTQISCTGNCRLRYVRFRRERILVGVSAQRWSLLSMNGSLDPV